MSINKDYFVSALAECIVNNSNIGAEEDDAILFSGVEVVFENVSPEGSDVTVLFTDGTAIKIEISDAGE